MKECQIIPIINSVGFAIRGMRTQKDYLDYLVKKEQKKISVIVLASLVFKEIVEETFLQTGVKVNFEVYEEKILDKEKINTIAKKYYTSEENIVTESRAMDYLRQNLKENYPIIFDNYGIAHPMPNKPSLFASKKTVEQVIDRLRTVAESAKNNTDGRDGKVIFLPFSGLKSFGTDYGKKLSEKEQIAKFMSFPFEDSIPAIAKIQKELKKHNIIVIPVAIQYGSLEEIHNNIFQLSKQHNLNPIPTSLDIDWNRDFAKQVGFFHALNQWSEETGLPNIGILHGSSCLHLVEECANPSRIIAFYGTHTETLKLEDDGRVYHSAVAEKSGGWLRAIKPPIPDSHNYKLVAEQIAEEAPKVILEKLF
ncbi:MAG: hypothetical protein WBA93_01840 [Microcoleaceae cyanobacterium]